MKSLPLPTPAPLRGGPTLRWGVLAPGVIARAFTHALHTHTDQRVHAVGSRTKERAEQFARDYDIPRAYDSYEALVADDGIDVVYIAAPHSEHHALALLAIAAGKHVLVEKPIAVRAWQAIEIAAAARAAGVFAMEAMWSRYLPQATVVDSLMRNGELGDVKFVTADASWYFEFDAASRAFDPALGGGALLDAGVYSFWFSQFALGNPTAIASFGSLAPTGVDAQAVSALQFASGAQAAISTSILVDSPSQGSIFGTKGSVRYENGFIYPSAFRLTIGGDETEWKDESGVQARDGLAWQAVALAGFVADGRTESPLHSLDDSIALMQSLDEVRTQLGAK
ncbi:MAG: oxidoreductase [Glaciihabitans sp.]|nr:oxidoreductase [Glaciihabitans sp.]